MTEALSLMRGLQFDWYQFTVPGVSTPTQVSDWLRDHWTHAPVDIYGEVQPDVNDTTSPRQTLGVTRQRVNNYPERGSMRDRYGRELASYHWMGGKTNPDLHIKSTGDVSPLIARWIRSLADTYPHRISRVDVALDFLGPHTRYDMVDALDSWAVPPEDLDSEDLSFLPDFTAGYGPVIGEDTGAFEVVTRRIIHMLKNWSDIAGGGRPPKHRTIGCDPMSYSRGYGRTFNLGAFGEKDVDVKVRLYEKGVERLVSGVHPDDLVAMGLEHPRDWVRFEVEIHPIGSQKSDFSTKSEQELFCGARKYLQWLGNDILGLNLPLLERARVVPKTDQEKLEWLLTTHKNSLMAGMAGMSKEDIMATLFRLVPDLNPELRDDVFNDQARLANSDARKAIDKLVDAFAVELSAAIMPLDAHDVASVFALLKLPAPPLSKRPEDVSVALMLETERNREAAKHSGWELVSRRVDAWREELSGLNLSNLPLAPGMGFRATSVASMAMKATTKARPSVNENGGDSMSPRRLQ